ncbi:MAG: FG-GAP-like repeat-containing protein [Pyrinomonadaceae bacterium]
MQRFSYSTLSRWAKPLLGYMAIVLAMALLSSTLVRTPTVASAQDADKADQLVPETTAATFPGTGVGAIPDSPGGTPPVYGTPLVVSYVVSGLTGTNVATVDLSYTATHSWIGDLDVVLKAPGAGPSHVIHSRVGALTATSFGASSDLVGAYTFTDTATGTNIWTAAAGTTIPVGSYRTTAAGPQATSPAPVTSLNTAFSGVTAAAANGTWTLTIRDGGGGDTGSVTASSLTITTAGPASCTTARRPVDYDGNGRSDFSVVRNTGGGPSGQVTWFNQLNGGAGTSLATGWGIATDRFVPNDFDGDGKTDIAVWRPGAPFNAYFYILQSGTNTFRSDQFGQTGDDPTVVGDYDGDGKSDPAIYRAGAATGDHSFWWYRSSLTGVITLGAEWGQNGDFPAPGDYDGDNKFDYVVQRNAGGGQAGFFEKLSGGGTFTTVFGTPTDTIVPGYYDDDCKTDIATTRGSGGLILWNVRKSTDGTFTSTFWGNSATDLQTQGDYDGDGRTDLAVWRPNADPTQNFFYFIRSSDSVQSSYEWGQNGDFPVAHFNSH